MANESENDTQPKFYLDGAKIAVPGSWPSSKKRLMIRGLPTLPCFEFRGYIQMRVTGSLGQQYFPGKPIRNVDQSVASKQPMLNSCLAMQFRAHLNSQSAILFFGVFTWDWELVKSGLG